MVLRHSQIQGLAHEGHRLQLLILVQAEGQVDLPSFQLLKQVEGGGLGKLEADALVFLLVVDAHHHRGDEGGGDGVEISQADDLLGGARHLPEHPDPLVNHGQSLLGVGEELLAIAGQADVAAVLLKELHPQLLLQLLDGVAQAGLGDMELSGGMRVVEHPGQGLEILQLKQRHKNPPFPDDSFFLLYSNRRFLASKHQGISLFCKNLRSPLTAGQMIEELYRVRESRYWT